MGIGQFVEEADLLRPDRIGPAPVEVAGLPSNHNQGHRNLAVRCTEQLQRPPHDIAVEGAAEPLVGRDDDESLPARIPAKKQRVGLGVGPEGQAAQHLLHLEGVGACLQDALLSPAQLRGRHQLHRLGDLLRALDRRDAPLNIP